MSDGDVDFYNPAFVPDKEDVEMSINPAYMNHYNIINENNTETYKDVNETYVNRDEPNEDDNENEHHVKEAWDTNTEYIFNAIGYIIGLGNFWSFPSYIIKYGASFFIPYTFWFFIFGIPMFIMDVYLGQFTNRGIINCFGRCKLLSGIGLGTVVLNFVSLFPYTMAMVWAQFYLCISFEPGKYFIQESGNKTVFGSYIFFEKSGFGIEEATDGIANIGLPKWPLIISNFFVWLILFLCVFKGNKYSGKIIYVTSIIPFIFIFILLIYVSTLPNGFKDLGKHFHLRDIGNAQMWSDGALQTLFSLSLTMGGIPTLASFRKFKSDLLLSSILICCLDYLASIICTIVIIGMYSYVVTLPQWNIFQNTSISNIQLIFVILPEAIITNNKYNGQWTLLIYLTMLSLAFDTVISKIRIISQAAFELFGFPPRVYIKYYYLGLCLIGFIVLIPMCCSGGLYWQALIGHSISWCYIFLAFLITTFIIVCYGGLNVYYDIEFMLKETKFSNAIWQIFGRICLGLWYINPIITFILLIITFINYDLFTIPNRPVQPWVHFFEFLFSLSIPLSIIVYIIFYLFKRKGNLNQNFKYIVSTSEGWIEPLWYPHINDKKVLEDFDEFKKQKKSGNLLSLCNKKNDE